MIARKAALSLIFVFSVWTCARAGVGDSLIVEGVAIQVEINLAVDSVADPTIEMPPRTSRSFPGSLHIQCAGGAEHLQGATVSAEIGHAIRPLAAVALAWVPALNRATAVRPELRLGIQTFSALDFDVAQLHDSAVALEATVPGGLDQILLFHYELGVETDTLPIELTRVAIQVFSIDLGGRGVLMQHSRRPLFVHGGLRLAWRREGEGGRAVELGQGLDWRSEQGGLQTGLWAGFQRGLWARGRRGAGRDQVNGMYWGAEAHVLSSAQTPQRWGLALQLGVVIR